MVTTDQLQQFREKYRECLKRASWVIISGSIPEGVTGSIYSELVQVATSVSIPCLVDATGEVLQEALHSRPEIIKLNTEELKTTFDISTKKFCELVRDCLEIYRQHEMNNLVITCGNEGVLAYTKEGIFHAQAPEQSVINPAGAGDSVSAALAWRFSLGECWMEALRWSAAVSAAVVRTPGTGDCHLEDVKEILPQVTVTRKEGRNHG